MSVLGMKIKKVLKNKWYIPSKGRDDLDYSKRRPIQCPNNIQE